MWGVVGRGLATAAAVGFGSTLGNIAQQGIQQFINPLLLIPRYAANFSVQSLAPDMAALLPAYILGNISDDNWERVLGVNNIPFNHEKGNRWNRSYARMWQAAVNANLPKMSLAEMYYLLFSGQMPKDVFKDITGNYKFANKHAEYINKLFLPKFDQGIIFTNYFRGLADFPTTLEKVRRFYGCNENDAKDIIQSSQFVPPPQDVLRFIVKDVYDPDQIAKLGLDAEFDTVKDGIPWANAAGISKDTTIKYNGNTIKRDILKDYWVSHWQLMSPTQGYVAMQRLRPNRLFRYNQQIPGLKPFEFSELNALLKSNDYVPEQRKWLAASSYNLIGRIDLRRLYETDVIDETELLERYQDAGYNLEDSRVLTQYSKEEKVRKKKKEEDKEAIKNYSKYSQEVYSAYRVGAIGKTLAYNSLTMRGFDPDLVSANLDAIDIAINRERVQQYVKMIKDEFFLGLYDGLEAYTELVQGGLQDVRANQYVIRWQRQLSRPRRMAGVNTILDWVKRGLMSFLDAKSRLEKLGISNADTLLYLESAQQDIEKKIQLEQTNLARTEKQQQAEVATLFRRMQADAKAAQAQLRTYSSPAIMKRWFKQGMIDWQTVQDRLVFLGIPPQDIERYRKEFMPDEE